MTARRLGGLLLTLLLCLVTAAPVAADITSNLTHYWAFDEGTGTTADNTGSLGYDGTLVGNATWNSPGKIGASSLSLDGTGDYVTTATNAGMTRTTPLTICTWAYATASSSDVMVGTYYNNTPWDGLLLNWGTSSDSKATFYLITNTVATKGVKRTTASSLNTWTHICGTYDGSQTVAGFALYVNGALATVTQSNTGTWNEGFTDRPWRIGADTQATPNVFFSGYLDEIKIWARALAAGDIAEEYARGAPVVAAKKRILLY